MGLGKPTFFVDGRGFTANMRGLLGGFFSTELELE
jgi:hypothetical protein